jgi:hypothetical protein
MVGARSTVVRLPSRDTRCCRARRFPSSPRLFGTPYRWVAVVINLTDIFVSERRPPVDAASQQPVPWQHQLAPVHISIAIDMRRRSSSSSGQSTYACNDSDGSSVSAPAKKKKIRPPTSRACHCTSCRTEASPPIPASPQFACQQTSLPSAHFFPAKSTLHSFPGMCLAGGVAWSPRMCEGQGVLPAEATGVAGGRRDAQVATESSRCVPNGVG